jgi:hypothetical protein
MESCLSRVNKRIAELKADKSKYRRLEWLIGRWNQELGHYRNHEYTILPLYDLITV